MPPNIPLSQDVRARLRRHLSTVLEIVLDMAAWVGAASVAVYLRYALNVPNPEIKDLVKLIPIVLAVQVMVGLSIGLYRKRWRYGSFDEVAALVATAVITTVIIAIVNFRYLDHPLIPASSLWVAGFVGLILMAAVRYLWRLLQERRMRPDESAARTLVFGAGAGGEQIVTAMQKTPTSPFRPVGIIEDDPAKRRLRIAGVPVVGARAEMTTVARRLRASVLLVATPSASGELIEQLSVDAKAADMTVKVLPAVGELLTSPGLADIRDPTEADILGRHQISLDLVSISSYLNDRRVLVTGAGGSIGSELCRQISRFGPAELIMLDRDESALHEVQLSITRRALLDTPDVVLCDIRDDFSVKRIFEQRRPEVVFHAAALKHLPMLEQYPTEAVKANVWGTRSVLQAAVECGVERFVNISTDKAADPSSVLGYSKRVGECLTAAAAEGAVGIYLSVRFGNVLNSRGSVLMTFREQIAKGGPVTVTHPDVTRFFMTIPEAVQLVIQAGAVGRPGEVLVLDMGKPVRILDVAKRMIDQSGRDIQIEFTRLRPGEKLHEKLFGVDEQDARPFHPLISHTPVPPLSPLQVDFDTDHSTDAEAKAWLRRLVSAASLRRTSVE
jgi:FlaA1/EpsC-like NDP-sugar epimerase